MPIVGVLADASVLLSAIVGKSALRVCTEFGIKVHTPQYNADEVTEYLPENGSKCHPIEMTGHKSPRFGRRCPEI